MNSVLQVVLGSLPVLIAAIIVMIVKKKKIVPIVAIVLQLAVAVTTVVFTGSGELANSSVDAIDMYNVYSSLRNNPKEAENLLAQRNKSLACSIKYTLAKARLYAAKGKWEEANLLYQKVEREDSRLLDDREKELIENFKSRKFFTSKRLSYNVTNAKYLKSQGQKPEDYGFVLLTEEQIKDNVEYLDNFQKEVIPEIVEEVVEELEEEYEVLSDIDIINALTEKVMAYDYRTYKGHGNDPYVETESSDKDSDEDSDEDSYDKYDDVDYGIYYDLVKEDVSKLEDKARRSYYDEVFSVLSHYREQYPELFIEDKYLEAYIMACVKSGNELDALLAEDNLDVLKTVMDMYLAGIVTEGDFSSEFADEYREKYEEVMEQVKEVEEELADSEDDLYVGDVKLPQAVETLEDNEETELAYITDKFAWITENEEVPVSDLSDNYLGISVSKNKQGFGSVSVDYFNKAVENGKDSNNVVVQEAMDNIHEIYEDGAGDTNFIDVSEMVSDAYTENHYYDIATDELTDSVKSTAGTAISQTAALIAIGRINADKFSTIEATVVYSSKKALTDVKVTLKDCDIDIKDFEIKKKQYSGSEVILLCDVSGSMSNSFDALKKAVIQYVDTMEAGEKVNIITFDNNIKQVSGFSNDKDMLKEFAEKNLHQQGGTSAADSAYKVLDMFSKTDIAKTLVMMTDGEDNSPWAESDLVDKFSNKSASAGATIYAVGLGENLDVRYLTTIATAGAGRFIYCSDESALTNAYNYIHKRISSEYVVTFEAEDLDLVSRKLYIEVEDETSSIVPKDTKNYSLKGEEEDDDTEVEFESVLPEGVTIDGLDVNQIEKKSTSQTVNILGGGFDKVKVTDVYIESPSGNSHCKIKKVEKDKINFQIAPSVKEGEYSVFVNIDGKKYKVDRLTIGNSNPGEVTFGAYTFKADNITKNDDKTVLEGNVSLNDYLYFKGNVELRGDIDKDVSVTLWTNKEAYVRHDVASYSTFDKILLPNSTQTLAFNGIEVTIFDDGKNYNNFEEYQTDIPAISKVGVVDLGIVSLEVDQTRIYPDRVTVKASVGILKDNTITDLLTNGVEFLKVDKLPAYGKGEIEAEARLMKEGPFSYFNMDIEAGVNSETGIEIVDYISIEAKAGLKVMFDTYNREVGLGISFSSEEEDHGDHSNKKAYTLCSGDAGIEFTIKGEEGNRRYGDRLLDLKVALPLSITFYVEGVPVTLTDIEAELTDYNISEMIKNLTSGRAFTNALKSYMTNKEGAMLKVSGSIELISTAALPDSVASKIKKWLGDDVSLVSLDELYGAAGVNFPYLGAGATLQVLGCIDIAQMEMELGAIAYRDYVTDLLNASDGQKHYGFSFMSKAGIKFDWDLVGADVGGEISATITVDRFLLAVYAKAKVAANAHIELFGTGIDVEGEAKAEACAGVWKDNKWKAHVTIVASVDGVGKLKVFGYNVAEKEVHEKVTVIDEEFSR